MQSRRCTGHYLKWLFGLLLILWRPALPQAQQYNFRSWTQEHGLPQSQVKEILQDNKGQLWLATRSGLSRFNGTTFHTYTRRQGLSSNHITSLLQDSQNQIWIGTAGHGLMVYNGSEFKHAPTYTPPDAGSINSLAEDNMGRIWTATDSGVFFIREDSLVRSRQFPDHVYTAILCTAAGEIWAGSMEAGLFRSAATGVTSFTTQTSNLPANKVTAILQDEEGTLWVGTNKGVAVHKQGKFTLLQLPASISQPDVVCLAQDHEQNIWIGLRQEGVLKYDGNTFKHITQKNGLKSNRITAISPDLEGNIWIGTDGQGLQQYKNPWFTHYFDFGEIEEPRITALAQDTQGRLWVGTEDGHAAYMEQEQLQWLRTDLWPKGTTLYDMWVKTENEVWVCTSNGIWKLQPKRATHYSRQDGLPANEVYQCLPDQTGALWFATANGIAKFAKGKFTTLEGRPLGKVHFLHLDRQNSLWAGTEQGIFREKNGAMAEVPALRPFNFRDVYAISEDSLGNLYFGGYDHGILATDQHLLHPTIFNTDNGLPDESILSLYIDSQNFLWAGTSRSVMKANLASFQQERKLHFRTYTVSDGFRGREVSRNSIIQTPDGAVWFGTARGLTKYTHHLDKRNQVYPSASLTRIELFMQPADWHEMGFETDTATGLPVKLRLRHDQNHITFNFHGISLSGPEQVRYRYRLVGHQEEWSGITSKTSATYANLSPGSYTFQVMARNNDGYWTPDPVSFTFSVAPPVWKREWFIGVMLLAMAGAIISLIRLRERNLVKQNSLLEQRVKHRTRMLEEKNREKETLLKEIHHRVKNNLQIVISLLNLQVRHIQDPESIQVMRALRNRVQSMALLHERLYQHEDLAQIDLANYFAGICESLYSSFGTRPEQVILKLDIPHIKVDIDSAITLGLIVNELVSNTLKYAFPDGQKGVLHICLQQSEPHYYMTIADDGVGLPAGFDQQRTASFGLRLVNSLIKKLNGRLELKCDKGTTHILHFNL